MKSLSDLTVIGNIFSRYSVIPEFEIIQGVGGDINDQVLDFKNKQIFIIDLRNKVYVGSSGNIQIELVTEDLVVGNQNRLMIIQDNPIQSNLDISFVTTDPNTTFADLSGLNAYVNQPGKISVLDFILVKLPGGTDEYLWEVPQITTQGYSENTTYGSPSIIVNGENYNQSLTRLDTILGKLVPNPPNTLSSATLNQQTSGVEHFKLSDGSSQDLIVANTDIMVFLTSGEFLAETGVMDAILDAVNVGSIIISEPFVNASNGSLEVNFGLTSDNFYDIFTIIRINGNIPDNLEDLHSVNWEFGAYTSNVVNFYKTRADAFPTPTQPSNAQLNTTLPSTKRAGIPCFIGGETLPIQATYNNVVFQYSPGLGWYRDLVGSIFPTSGSWFNNVNVLLSDEGVTNVDLQGSSPNTPLLISDIIIKSGIYLEGASLSIISSNVNASSAATVVSDYDTSTQILIDSKTDEAGLVYEYDHSRDLTATLPAGQTDVMLLNQILKIPEGNWTAYGGPDYSGVDPTIERKIVLNSINAGLKDLVTVTLPNVTGISNAALDSLGNYRMEVTRSDKPGETYDGNAAYDLVGVVQDTEGCLVVSNSDKNNKTITFGENLNLGVTVGITIYIKNTVTIGQDISVSTS